jgi:RimJ/RimL family protein N-acetyltransferase
MNAGQARRPALIGEVVGLVSLVFEADHRIALLGYGIHKDYRGIGLTGEAVRAVLTEAFAVYQQLTKVTVNTDARNHSSSRLLEKLGFQHEFIHGEVNNADGQNTDDDEIQLATRLVGDGLSALDPRRR